MPRLKITASLLRLDHSKYLKDFNAALRTAAIKGARAFLLAAIPRVPVFTGFSKGAFGNLEDIAGRVVGTTIKGTQKGRTRGLYLRKEKRYYYYPPSGGRVTKNTVSGRQFATPADQIIPSGRLTTVQTRNRLLFQFGIDITYFNYLDKEWGAFEAGQKAFLAEFKTQMENLRPKLRNYLLRKELKSG